MSGMQARRLSWAGVEIIADGRRILIDPMETTIQFERLLGEPLWHPLPIGPSPGGVPVDALVTHRHPDHYDPTVLKSTLGPGGRVYCPVELVVEVEQAGLNARGVALWETVRPPGSMDLSITAVPAVDWRGDAQVSWVVETGNRRIFHGGDTIWHGSWWAIAKRFGTFDVAFLPVNGVIVHMSGMDPSNLPATLTPKQAAVAARLLNARVFCPIHYGQFSRPETYLEYPDLADAVERAALSEGIDLQMLRDGEAIRSN